MTRERAREYANDRAGDYSIRTKQWEIAYWSYMYEHADYSESEMRYAEKMLTIYVAKALEVV